MALWTGTLTLPSYGGSKIDLSNISLHPPSPTPGSSTTPLLSHLRTHFPPTTTLQFLRYLPPSCIPFYLATTPSLTLTTPSLQSTLWLNHFFTSSLPISNPTRTDDVPPPQPGLSILLRVTPPETSPNKSNYAITELLLYGVLAPPAPAPATTGLTTPPTSSPPPSSSPNIEIYALPLSSRHNFPTPLLPPSPPTSPTSAGASGARFIAPNPREAIAPAISSVAKKRRADVLDRAAAGREKRPKFPVLAALGERAINKGARGSVTPAPEKGGVAGAAAGRLSRAGSVAGSVAGAATGRSRAGSVVSIVGRPMSRCGTGIESQSRPGSAAGGGWVKRERDSTVAPDSDVDKRNKDLLTKIVLEAMSRRGMRNYRRARKVERDGEEEEVGLEEREEFKGVFHMTVKAAPFALRKEVGEWDVERVKAVVEGLVTVFCGAEEDVRVKKEEEDEPEGIAGMIGLGSVTSGMPILVEDEEEEDEEEEGVLPMLFGQKSMQV